MKNFIITIVIGVTALFVTSCTNIYEEAYQAEHNYKLYRDKNWSDTLLYKQQFLDVYTSMSYNERESYKRYREEKDAEALAARTLETYINAEAIEMLNN